MGMVANPARDQLNREKEKEIMSLFARGNLVSRDGFGRPVPVGASFFRHPMLNQYEVYHEFMDFF